MHTYRYLNIIHNRKKSWSLKIIVFIVESIKNYLKLLFVINGTTTSFFLEGVHVM